MPLRWWVADSPFEYFITLLAVFCFGVLHEGLDHLDRRHHALYQKVSAGRYGIHAGESSEGEGLLDGDEVAVTSGVNHIRTRWLWACGAYGCKVCWGFFSMFLLMTFNTGVCAALLAGVMVGHVLTIG
eukprot:TRINITY_DN7067_c0_g1_i1.p3 TRINITY_DN7067_c0_g1~~TRINITY_DN7067_c0_g1_i1.p3  ORF type:complete len:128 (+),score=20.53 TRINITY_DN7067_c0_g1_i1:249-632(+)